MWSFLLAGKYAVKRRQQMEGSNEVCREGRTRIGRGDFVVSLGGGTEWRVSEGAVPQTEGTASAGALWGR